MTESLCTIEGCERKLQARGWCSMHYARWKAVGEPGTAAPNRIKGKICSVEGCDRRHVGHELCATHLARHRKHGNTGTIGASGRPLKGDFPGWSAIHKRVMRAKGKASTHACVDCGGRAREWSYNGNDPHEIVAEDHGWVLAWSLDIDNYEPRCPSCHRIYDNKLRAGVTSDDTPDLMGKQCRIERAPAGTERAYMELRVVSRERS